MKLEFVGSAGGAGYLDSVSGRWLVRGETERLTDVMLCAPAFLEPVPCCSVTREQVRDGFAFSPDAALRQHGELRVALEALGVQCHIAPATPGLPDLCFTRDVAVMTPWGLIALNPALAHRQREVECAVSAARQAGVEPLARIAAGTIEGGDVCIARHGLLILGCSGERTNPEGAEEFAARFRRNGWDVLVYRFDPHFLHLDTIFCMLDETHALACVDVLSDAFLAELAARGIDLIPVSYKEAQRLGCNVLSIDGRTILIGEGQDRVAGCLAQAGFAPVEVNISQLAACGGGVHCLTLPLARGASPSPAR